MGSKRFRPGYNWKILAHEKESSGYKPDYTGKLLSINSKDFDKPYKFDELVIDNWFHLEQMDTRCWWIGIGEDIHIHISIAANKKIEFSIQDFREEV